MVAAKAGEEDVLFMVLGIGILNTRALMDGSPYRRFVSTSLTGRRKALRIPLHQSTWSGAKVFCQTSRVQVTTFVFRARRVHPEPVGESRVIHGKFFRRRKVIHRRLRGASRGSPRHR